TEGDVENAVGSDHTKVDRGRKLLTIRDQITLQATTAETAINERASRMRSRATKKKEDLIPNIDEEIAKNEQDIRFRAAAIRSLLDDLKKLADEIDPPAPKN